MKKFEIYFNDLKPEEQQEYLEFYNKSMELVQRLRSEEFLCKAESMKGIKREDELKYVREFEESLLPLKRFIEGEAVSYGTKTILYNR
jgi:hypothetical protein